MKPVFLMALGGCLLTISCEKSKAPVVRETVAPSVEKIPAVKADDAKMVADKAPDDTGENKRVRAEPRVDEKKYPKPEHPVAKAVGAGGGFVMSPFNDKIVDVRDIPSGTLVQDPSSPPEEKRYFRVP